MLFLNPTRQVRRKYDNAKINKWRHTITQHLYWGVFASMLKFILGYRHKCILDQNCNFNFSITIWQLHSKIPMLETAITWWLDNDNVATVANCLQHSDNPVMPTCSHCLVSDWWNRNFAVYIEIHMPSMDDVAYCNLSITGEWFSLVYEATPFETDKPSVHFFWILSTTEGVGISCGSAQKVYALEILPPSV